jgi:hypothetical protein
MDDPFAALAAWHDFFAAVAGGATTLVGLLFVAFALNPAIMADDSPAGLRIWAAQTFHNFLMVLVIALVALIPDVGPLGLGLPLVILGGWGAGPGHVATPGALGLLLRSDRTQSHHAGQEAAAAAPHALRVAWGRSLLLQRSQPLPE